MKQEDPISWYIKNRPLFKKLASKVENILIELFEIENLSYHMVTFRAKDVDSFRKKSLEDKYDDPKNQIQDLAGIRIITYVEDQVEQIRDVIEQTFDIDVPNSSDKSMDLGLDKVGYKSIHYVGHLKNDRLELPEYKQFKGLCFEIQIRTILQHAWAEIEHDRNYKFTGKLPHEIGRRFKLLAGSLEMADREFNNISREIDQITHVVKEETEKGNLNIEINSTTLSQFIKTRFEKLIENGLIIIPNSNALLIDEMNLFGLHKLSHFDKIIPKDFEKVFLDGMLEPKERTEVGLARLIMITNNYKKYFEKSFRDAFIIWGGYDDGLLKHYGVDWENDINKKHNVPFK